MELVPVYKPDGFAEHQMSDAEVVTVADILFTAVGAGT